MSHYTMAMPPKRMTPRRLEILKLAALGKTNTEICMILGLRTGTVKNHIQAIMYLLNANSRTFAVAKAITLGLISIAEEVKHD